MGGFFEALSLKTAHGVLKFREGRHGWVELKIE
jgi:hypothetical protein